MANVMLGYPNRVDDATLSGGSWLSALPLNNLKNRLLGIVARSTNALQTSTIINIDSGSAINVKAIALVNHNLSLDALYRLRCDDAADFATPLYDSGWLEVWPSVYSAEDLKWEDPNWWTGKYTEEEISGYVLTLVHPLDTALPVCRYRRIEIFDEGNADGYVQIGRLFLGPVMQPVVNMNYGVSIGLDTRTEVGEALSGAEYFNRRNPYRVVRFTLGFLKEGDALSRAFEIDRKAGIDRELLFIYDPDDTKQKLRRQFLGRLRVLSPIEHPYLERYSTAFEVKELLP